MLRRLGVPALLIALAAPLGTVPAAAAAPDEDVAPRAPASRCSTMPLVDRSAIRTRAGVRLGTARMYAAASEGGVDFCIRTTPVDRLRSRGTDVSLRLSTISADGVEMPGLTLRPSWKAPFRIYGVEPGATLRAETTLRPADGAKGTATVSGSVR
ncbi:hypothetical protein [Nocardioides baculatus]|uniref:Uncharacterized protein n=1 Tax=Nocardioides baculatus TaxID=2801337 RepID=A0ABS1LD22_9ACTN|nr:hypothetical protein [Nocardioides baculatus]MBL0749598.1 hypothetical protein [Nocardioides baculatus]